MVYLGSRRAGAGALAALLGAVLGLGLTGEAAADGELNLYSSRHYDTDEALYRTFEEETGITINRIEAGADKLIERMQAEGANSPADVILTVDAGRIWRAEEAGLLQPVESAVLETKLPEQFQHPDNLWFAFSQRVRIIFYAPERVSEPPMTYEALADPKYKGKICARSSSNIYMISLLASMIEHHGEEAAKEWVAGLKDNLARDPQGGDTDQLRGLISGECDIALSNHYYFVRGLAGDVDGLSSDIDKIAWVFPNQSDRGAHVNVSAAAVAKHAPNYDNAVKFLEYLASPKAQEYLAAGNHEYPVVTGVALGEHVSKLGLFRQDNLNLSALGRNQAKAQLLYDLVGYK